MATTRIEHDLLGDKAVPADAYYGVQTARALENFHISGVELRLYPNLIKAFAMVKLAASVVIIAAVLVGSSKGDSSPTETSPLAHAPEAAPSIGVLVVSRVARRARLPYSPSSHSS